MLSMAMLEGPLLSMIFLYFDCGRPSVVDGTRYFIASRIHLQEKKSHSNNTFSFHDSDNSADVTAERQPLLHLSERT